MSCPVPLVLKGNILQTLAALAKSKETATILWNIIETSQLIPTIPVISSNSKYNITPNSTILSPFDTLLHNQYLSVLKFCFSLKL